MDALGRGDAWPLWRLALCAQAAYFTLTGVWPFVHRASFEAITGPKQDWWLVQTVGAVVAVVGVVVGRAVIADREPRGDVLALAAGSAAALGAVEAYYAARRRISVVYALDAVLELAFVIGAIRGVRRVPTAMADASGFIAVIVLLTLRQPWKGNACASLYGSGGDGTVRGRTT